jgi:hypothetical protein
MNCDTIIEQMSEALDGQLDATQQTAFDAHLAQCPACRDVYADLEQTVSLLHELPPVAPPADLIPNIEAAIDQPLKPVRRWWNSPQVRAAMAASLMLAVGLFAIQQMAPPPREDAQALADEAQPPNLPQPAMAPVDDRLLGQDADDEVLETEEKQQPARQNVTMPKAKMMQARPEGRPEPAEPAVEMDAVAAAAPQSEPTLPRPPPAASRRLERELEPAPKPILRAKKDTGAVAAARQDTFWREPAPPGVKGGLRAIEEETLTRPAPSAAPAAAESQGLMKARRARASTAINETVKEVAHRPLLQLGVTGLTRERILQAARAPDLKKGAAPGLKRESRDQLTSSLTPTDTPSELSGDAKSFDKAADLVLHLPRHQLDAFLEHLKQQATQVTIHTRPSAGPTNALVEVRINLAP